MGVAVAKVSDLLFAEFEPDERGAQLIEHAPRRHPDTHKPRQFILESVDHAAPDNSRSIFGALDLRQDAVFESGDPFATFRSAGPRFVDWEVERYPPFAQHEHTVR